MSDICIGIVTATAEMARLDIYQSVHGNNPALLAWNMDSACQYVDENPGIWKQVHE